jgi:hypothetical protein
MKAKAYPPILATCALLGAPASAGASTLEVFTVSGSSSFGGMTTTTLSGTFDYNGGVFSNFAITATYVASSSSDLFDVNNGSSNSEIQALSSANSMASLTLLPSTSLDMIAPGGSTTFHGTLQCSSSLQICPEAPFGSLTASAAATPLPASLPLFAGGLGAMALLRRLRRHAAQSSN